MCVFVWGIVGWAFYVYNYLLCVTVLTNPAAQTIFMLVFTVLWLLLITSNLRTTFRDPGSVPIGYTPVRGNCLDHLSSADPLQQEGIDPEAPPPSGNRSSRYCSKCKCYKPERTHHCASGDSPPSIPWHLTQHFLQLLVCRQCM